MTKPALGQLIALDRGVDRSHLTDEQLVASCANGDRGALAALFRRHGDRAFRILARTRGIDRADLEDLVQTTFLEVGRAAARFDGRSAVGTWILAIALNVGRNHVRGEVRRRSALRELTDAPPLLPRAIDEQASRKQSLLRLQAAAANLPEHLRTVFVLVDVEGLKGAEAARLLGIPEGTLWRRLHEVHERLRAVVKERER